MLERRGGRKGFGDVPAIRGHGGSGGKLSLRRHEQMFADSRGNYPFSVEADGG
jgi:hypothetical protein